MVLELLLGVFFLYIGAYLLVYGAASTALYFGVSKLIVALTVVAYATSAPEALVTLLAAFQEKPQLCLGNVVGSNICNTLAILGISALISPCRLDRKLMRYDIPVCATASLLLLGAFLFFEDISYGEGVFFLICSLLYTLLAVYRAKEESLEYEKKPIVKSVLAVVGGGILLYFGAESFLSSSIAIARVCGVGEATIGLTLVAAGTSFPELATTLVAAYKGEHEISLGNIIGSNIFNIFLVLGLGAIVQPIVLYGEGVSLFDVGVMVFSLVLVVTFREIDRWKGGVLLLCYVAYLFLKLFHNIV